MKATEQYFPVVLFIMLYKVVLTFESVGEIPKCDHSNESHWAALSCGPVYQCCPRWSVSSLDEIQEWTFKRKTPLNRTFLWYCFPSNFPNKHGDVFHVGHLSWLKKPARSRQLLPGQGREGIRRRPREGSRHDGLMTFYIDSSNIGWCWSNLLKMPFQSAVSGNTPMLAWEKSVVIA